MELRTLKYFTVVAEELNITHAAERLCMSQPPLSNQMKALEDELGCALFVRGKRKLQLTDAGRLLFQRAVQILDMAERTQHEVMSLSGGWLMHRRSAAWVIFNSSATTVKYFSVLRSIFIYNSHFCYDHISYQNNMITAMVYVFYLSCRLC